MEWLLTSLLIAVSMTLLILGLLLIGPLAVIPWFAASMWLTRTAIQTPQ